MLAKQLIIHLKIAQMKKLFTVLLVAGMFGIVACGPSEEEKAKALEGLEEMEEDTEDLLNNLEEPATEEEATEEVTEEATEEEEESAEEAEEMSEEQE